MTTNSVVKIARTILSDKGLGSQFPVDVPVLAKGERVEIREINTSRRFDGRLELCEGTPTIFINTRGQGMDRPRVRFTLAHELGHFFLHRRLLTPGRAFHDEDVLAEGDLAFVEREANSFAAECLLPQGLVDRFLDGAILSLGSVERLARQAQASLQATAIRVASRTSSRCCFFFESAGAIQWMAPSDDWKEARMPWSRWRGSLPEMSHSAVDRGSFEEREVAYSCWSPNSRGRSEPLFESALEVGGGRLVFVVDGSAEGYLE